jgi:DNA-binding transcriptional ArsR family regulator
MATDDPTATLERTLTTEEEIAAYLHRTRMAVLDALRDGPATVTQVATRLGVHPANLTRHVRALERAGLIALVEKRDTGRNLEKYYAATARHFRVAPGIAALAAPHRIALTFAASEIAAAAVRLPATDAGPVAALVTRATVPPSQATAFARELGALAQRFGAADAGTGQAFHLVLALYPGGDDVHDGPPIRLGSPEEEER